MKSPGLLHVRDQGGGRLVYYLHLHRMGLRGASAVFA